MDAEEGNRIFLIGYRGTGKSTVARLLAAALGWDWLDADAELETRSGRILGVRMEDGVAPRGPLPYPYTGDGDGAGPAPSRPVPTRRVDGSADLERTRVKPRWVEICFTVTFLAYVVLIPHFLRYDNPPTGDQPFYLMDVISLAQDDDLNVKNNYDNNDFDKFYKLSPYPPGSPGFAGISAPYPLPRQLADSKARPSTEQYSARAIGEPYSRSSRRRVGPPVNDRYMPYRGMRSGDRYSKSPRSSLASVTGVSMS